MKSLGLWYKLDKENEHINKNEENFNANNISEKCDDNDVSFEMHINLWSKMQCKNESNTFLDMGIKINNYSKLAYLNLVCPFKLENDNIIDLAPHMKIKKNANLIFNNECEIETSGNYTIIHDNEIRENGKQDILVYPLNQSMDKMFDIKEINENNYKLQINFNKFKKYINDETIQSNINNLKKIDTIYIRFRIKSSNLEEMIISKIVPKNTYFESVFTTTQIVDFKINKKRNIDENVLVNSIINKEILIRFRKIHFLLMEPANNDVLDISNDMTDCRKLESRVWNDYLELDNKNNCTDNILVYHWKYTAKKNEKLINEFGKLVKITYSKTNKKIMTTYICGVILISIISGIFSNLSYNLISSKLENKINDVHTIDWILGLGPSIIIVIILVILELLKRKKLLKNFLNH